MSIAIRNISKQFGAFKALDDVSIDIPSGELVALLGTLRLRQDDAAADHRRS
jgi:ABC-type sulfate/molybdate transport systems ATPase subunit